MLDLKRVDVLPRALAMMRGNRIEFAARIIGDGPEKPRLKRMCGELGLEDSIEFKPFAQSDEIRRQMAEADVYVLPSDYREGWGAMVSGAMFEDCAVVASKGVGAGPVLIRTRRHWTVFSGRRLPRSG